MQYSILELEAMLKSAKAIQSKNNDSKAVKAQITRDKAKLRFKNLIPKIKVYLKTNLKIGDIIICKGYRGYKEVLEVKEHEVLAICGRIYKGKFVRSAYSSATMLEHVTGIIRNNKIVKVKDLI